MVHFAVPQVNLMEMMSTCTQRTVTLSMSLMNLNSKYIVRLAPWNEVYCLCDVVPYNYYCLPVCRLVSLETSPPRKAGVWSNSHMNFVLHCQQSQVGGKATSHHTWAP